MLRSVKELVGADIAARDGKIGEAEDFFFDDHLWQIRYLVVDTGRWLPGREVLISPASIKQPDRSADTLPVDLTCDEIEKSPPVDADKPFSRQQEEQLTDHFGWPSYWGGMMDAGMGPSLTSGLPPVVPIKFTDTDTGSDGPLGDPNLRSANELIGSYNIQGSDKKIGHVGDFIVDDETWTLRYMVVDIRDWLPGRHVILAVEWIKAVHWEEEDVVIDLSAEQIKTGPKYDPTQPIVRQYEQQIYDHYDRPGYWQE